MAASGASDFASPDARTTIASAAASGRWEIQHRRRRLRSRSARQRVARDADDREPRFIVLPRDAESVSESAMARPVLSSEALVHDHLTRLRGRVGERRALDELDSHRREVRGLDIVDVDERR